MTVYLVILIEKYTSMFVGLAGCFRSRDAAESLQFRLNRPDARNYASIEEQELQ